MIKGLLYETELEVDSDSEASDKEEQQDQKIEEEDVNLLNENIKKEFLANVAGQVTKTSGCSSNLDNSNAKQDEMRKRKRYADVAKCSTFIENNPSEQNIPRSSKHARISWDTVSVPSYFNKEEIESRIYKAIKKGDIQKADELNDELGHMEMLLQHNQAIDAKNLEIKRNKHLQEKIKMKRTKLKWTN